MPPVEFKFKDPFQAIHEVDPESIQALHEAGLQLLVAEGNRSNLGAELRTSGGHAYLWGPNMEIRMNQWQDFILRTRNKEDGFVVHYSQVDNFSKNLWADFVDRHTIQPPLKDHSGFWLYNKIITTGEKTAVILSGRLLADFLDWVKVKGLELKKDVVFTTFEPFPKSKIPLLLEYFEDWCDYMRSWDGGLTFFRCKHGTYHTFDHITIAKPSPDSSVLVTDLLNKAQNFIDHSPGDVVHMDDEYSRCECGLWHRNFRQITWDSFKLHRADGTKTQRIGTIDDVTNDFQIYQEQAGEVFLLRHGGWDGVDMPPIFSKIEEQGVKVVPAGGIFRRHTKVPFFFNRLMTTSHGGKIYNFDPKIESFDATPL